MTKFLREPPSIRLAAGVIVTATLIVVVGGGALMRLIDHSEYKNVWVGMWWALQTVTTVGYGDVTPAHTSGRIVATFVMLEGIAFLTILTAAITSTFIARGQQERAAAILAADDVQEDRLDESLANLAERLERIEAILRAPTTR
jgi:voltage-gated potassium channel Kch